MNVLQKVHHPHTVQFFGAVTKQTPYMIITEFMGCGSMADMFRLVLSVVWLLHAQTGVAHPAWSIHVQQQQ